MRILKKLSALLCLCLILSPLTYLSYGNTVRADEVPAKDVAFADETIPETGDNDVESVDVFGQDVWPEDISEGYQLFSQECVTAIEVAFRAHNDSVDISAFNIPYNQQLLFEDVTVFMKSHPLFFYGTITSFRYRGSQLISLSFTYEYSKEEVASMMPAFEAAANEALSQVQSSMTDYQKALVLHDWLAYHAEYAKERLDNDALIFDDYTAYGALVKGICVCEGYSMAYMYLLQKCGITCYYAANDQINHAWNVVKIGSSYYNVDVTWDDPTEDLIGRVRHIYFLVDNETMLDRSQGGNPHLPPENFDASKLTSKTYVNGKWVDVRSPITYYKGNWYYSKWADSKYCALLYKTSNILTTEGTAFYTFGSSLGQWTTTGNRYYSGSFSYPVVFGHYLIFNTNQSICYFDLDNLGSTPSVMYGASELYGVNVASGYCVYGCKVDRNYIYYIVNTEPNKTTIRNLTNKLKGSITDTPSPTKKVTTTPTPTPVTEKTVEIGKSFQYTLHGYSASGLTWSIGNTSIATVDAKGVVTGKSFGNTYLTVGLPNGTKVKCLVKVVYPALKLVYSEKTLHIKQSFLFSVSNAYGQKITWSVGNTSVATVDTNGKVTGKSAANTYLYAKSADGRTAKCLLKIIDPGTLSINYTEKTVYLGQSFTFTARNTGILKPTWSVGNTAVAKVDSNGKVTPLKAGNTYLYVKTEDGRSAKCLLKIVDSSQLSITYTEKTIKVGSSFQFTAKNPAGQTVTWRVGNTSVAVVTSNGKVTGRKAGNTWLYASTPDGREAKCLLKIVA
ncbi:MAG: Ig-like domain-containing protein [Clostridiales bacterium]|nr:Ig-like domain-containing protein [Clostridiales bacterium]